jgi:hypothetical protein
VFDDLVELGLGDGRITPRLTAGLGRALVLHGAHAARAARAAHAARRIRPHRPEDS